MSITDNAASQHQQIRSVQKPYRIDLSFLQHWLERPGFGNHALIGRDRNVWEAKQGLMSLAKGPGELDVFTKRLLFFLPKAFDTLIIRPYHAVFHRWLKVCLFGHNVAPY